MSKFPVSTQTQVVASVPVYPIGFTGYQPSKANPNPAAMNRQKMDQIYSAYRREIDQAVSLTGVPRELILGIVFTESSGNATISVPPVSATGLMQLTPSTADTMLFMEKSRNRLTLRSWLSAEDSWVTGSTVSSSRNTSCTSCRQTVTREEPSPSQI